MDNFKTITFNTDKLSMNVIIKDNTAWLSTIELKQLFGVSQPTLSRYIKSTYNELKAAMNNSENEIFKTENFICQNGESKSNRKVIHYNLSFALELEKKLNSKIIDELKGLIHTKSIASEENNLVTYSNGAINVDVSISPKEETVWLNQAQIAALFDTTQPNVSMHISNILSDYELNESVYKDFLYTGSDGKQYSMKFYNLDMILAVGYRIKSKRAIEFRKWASKILKDYMMKGYVYNEDRLNACVDNIIKINSELSKFEAELDTLKKKINVKKETLFAAGEYYDSYIYISELISEAKSSIKIIDPYFDENTLSYIKSAAKDLNIKVYLRNSDKLNKEKLKRFSKQYTKTHFYTMKHMHDRFIIIDGIDCYSIGTSLNYAGGKTFAVIKIDNSQLVAMINKMTNKCKILELE